MCGTVGVLTAVCTCTVWMNNIHVHVYREKRIPIVGLWCSAFNNHGWSSHDYFLFKTFFVKRKEYILVRTGIYSIITSQLSISFILQVWAWACVRLCTSSINWPRTSPANELTQCVVLSWHKYIYSVYTTVHVHCTCRFKLVKNNYRDNPAGHKNN